MAQDWRSAVGRFLRRLCSSECFGSLRSQKNVLTAAGAALIASAELRQPGEFWVSTGRDDGGDQRVVLEAVRALLSGPGKVKIVENHWQPSGRVPCNRGSHGRLAPTVLHRVLERGDRRRHRRGRAERRVDGSSLGPRLLEGRFGRHGEHGQEGGRLRRRPCECDSRRQECVAQVRRGRGQCLGGVAHMNPREADQAGVDEARRRND